MVQNHFRIDVNGGVGYCYIRKNACSSFRRFIVETSSLAEREQVQPDGRDRMRFMVEHHKMRRHELEALPALIVVLRDPLERVVSGFLNQFVMRIGKRSTDLHRSIEDAVENTSESVTFNEFVNSYLACRPWEHVDRHFWPQVRYLAPVTYTHVLSQGTLAEDTERVFGSDASKRYFETRLNSTQGIERTQWYGAEDLAAGTLVRRFRKKKPLPRERDFLSGQGHTVLNRIYGDDVAVFEAYQRVRSQGRWPVRLDGAGLAVC